MELSKFLEEYSRIIDGKRRVIKSQSYEEAARLRDSEKHILSQFKSSIEGDLKIKWEEYYESNRDVPPLGVHSQKIIKYGYRKDFESFLREYLKSELGFDTTLDNPFASWRESKLSNILDK